MQLDIDLTDFICPISLQIMRDPVVASDGFTYEANEIEKWIRKNKTSPLTCEPITTALYSNKFVLKTINELELKNPSIQFDRYKYDLLSWLKYYAKGISPYACFIGTHIFFDKTGKIYKDYPVVECDKYNSVKNVWNGKYKKTESIRDKNRYCSPSPTYEWCEKNGLNPGYSFDIAISQDDKLIYGIHIVDKHQISFKTYISKSKTCYENNIDGNRFTFFEFDANWILNQKNKPNVLKTRDCNSFYGSVYSHSYFFEDREPFKNKQGIVKFIENLSQEIYDSVKCEQNKYTHNTIKKYKKEKIPSTLRALVWNTYIGEGEGRGSCYACEKEKLNPFEFECGHIIAESKGGETNLDNLRPVCTKCNRSIGSQNMDDFKKKYIMKITN